jgi:hypothetical protein
MGQRAPENGELLGEGRRSAASEKRGVAGVASASDSFLRILDGFRDTLGYDAVREAAAAIHAGKIEAPVVLRILRAIEEIPRSGEVEEDSYAALVRAAMRFCTDPVLKNVPSSALGLECALRSVRAPIGAGAIESMARIAARTPNGDLTALSPMLIILGRELRTEHLTAVEMYLESRPRFPVYALKELLPQAIVEHRSYPALRKWAPIGIAVAVKGGVGAMLANAVFGPTAAAEMVTWASVVGGFIVGIGAQVPGKWWPQKVQGEDLTTMFEGFECLCQSLPKDSPCPFPAVRPGMAHVLVANPEWFADAILKRAGLSPVYRAWRGLGVIWPSGDRDAFIEASALVLRVHHPSSS